MSSPSPSIETRLLELEDREAIRELLGQYALLAIKGEWAALTALFTEDGILDIRNPVGGGTRWYGHDEILENLTSKNLSVLPLVNNEVISIHGDRASCLHVMMTPVGPDPTSRGFAGLYSDSLVRIDGLWRFQERNFVPRMGNF